MIGEIIAVGDELTSGRILNTTSSFAAAQLFAAGHEIIAMTTVGDDVEIIGETLQRALGRAEFVIVSGGLGVTSDDLTNEAVVDVLDRPATFHPEILKKIRAYGKTVPEAVRVSLEKLAWLPAGAHELSSEAQTAGYFLVQDGKPVFFLPGVPHEMKELLLETVITRLAVWEGEELRTVRQKVYKVFGLAETEINDRFARLERLDRRIRIGYYPVFPEVEVSLTAAGDGRGETEALFRRADAEAQALLGAYMYGTDSDTLEIVVGRLLSGQGKTLAVAESCSGGLIAHKLTRVPGSSAYFLGGVVAYSNALKERFLGVEAETIRQHGAVSAATARAMAEGVVNATGADLGVSVTGIAGPTGGSEEKPVGTVYIGLAGPGLSRDFLYRFPGTRWQVQEMTGQTALDLVRRYLLNYELGPK